MVEVDRLRVVEVAALLADAADLGMGQPRGTAHRVALLCLRFAQSLRWTDAECADVLYVSLLRWSGCTSHAGAFGLFFDDEIEVHSRSLTMDFASVDPMLFLARNAGRGRGPGGRVRALGRAMAAGPRFTGDVFTASCEVAAQMALRLGLPAAVTSALGSVFERWDGRGFPGDRRGKDVPAAARLAAVVHDWTAFQRHGGAAAADAAIRTRAGRSLDPDLAGSFRDMAPDLIATVDAGLDSADGLDVLRDSEPGLPRQVVHADVGPVLHAVAEFSDLKLPFTAGQTAQVARLAAAAADALCPEARGEVELAALCHSVGRVGVPVGVWTRTTALRRTDWEQIRRYPYFTERLLADTALSGPAGYASLVQERLDGSGYHRGLPAAAQPLPARIVAAALAAAALGRPRPHRPPMGRDDIARLLRQECQQGRYDPRCVNAVLAAAGIRPRPAAWPAGLTDREVQVLRLAAGGLSKRQIAGRLALSTHTVDAHLRHIYTKIGVTTRAAATVFAMRHDLLEDDAIA